MIRKKLLVLAACAAFTVLLAGCGDGKVASTVSEAASEMGKDVSETVSRMESAVESFFGTESSHLDGTLSSNGSMAESHVSSMMGDGSAVSSEVR